jgi:hypothetical protein
VRIVASRSLRWAATEYLFQLDGEFKQGTVGEGVEFELPVTDSAGWRDARSGAFIDVSAPNSLTHTYEARLQLIRADGAKLGREFTLGPFTLPSGTGPFIVPSALKYPTEHGDVVLVPDLTKQYAEEAAESAAAADEDRQQAQSASQTAQEAAEAAEGFAQGLIPAFEHIQALPMGSWVVPHAFGRRPHVSVYIDDTEVEADVAATSTSVSISFATPVAGTAILS